MLLDIDLNVSISDAKLTTKSVLANIYCYYCFRYCIRRLNCCFNFFIGCNSIINYQLIRVC